MPDPISIPKQSPWMTQLLVIRALLNRETATRFGEYRLGFLWMLLEPLLGVLVIGLVIGTIAGRHVPEIPYTFFLLNGFLPLALFSGPMNAGLKALSSDQGLQVYPKVKPFDPILARFLFDLVTILFSFVFFCIVGMWMGITLSLSNLHIILAAYLITWLIGCGLGLVFGVMACHHNDFEKVIKVIFRPMLFISGVLFPISSVPTAVREIYLYNPLVHTIELSRHALFPLYRIEGPNLMYPATFAIIVFSIGITYFNRNRNLLSQL